MTRSITVLLMLLAWSARAVMAQSDPLPSWNDGPAKQAIVDFVARVTQEGGRDFVHADQRIATFDNDGTLWCEHPIYVQGAFIFDRIKTLAAEHPDWKTKEPFRSVLADDLKGVLSAGEPGLAELVAVTHSGMTTTDFNKTVADWLATARHPRFHRAYTALAYQPMLELLAYLRANGFKTFIVSGGGIEFMRPWTEKTYGIPPEQVVGSSGKLKYEARDGQPVLMKLPEVNFVDDGPGKPVGIEQHLGRRPLAAFGNSTGDRQMLQYTNAGDGARLAMLVLHDDAAREYAYGPANGLPDTKVGTFTPALYEEAQSNGWVVISMKNDWKRVFAFEE